MKRKNKKDRDKEIEELKQSLLDLIKETDSNATDEEIAKINEMVDGIAAKPRFKFSDVLGFILTFILQFALIYIICLLTLTPFLGDIVLSKFFIFAIAGGVAIIMILFEYLPLISMKTNPIAYIFIFLLLIAVAYLLNQKTLQIFSFSEIWIVYLVFIQIVYFTAKHCIKKMVFGGEVDE